MQEVQDLFWKTAKLKSTQKFLRVKTFASIGLLFSQNYLPQEFF
jgi:hypothetical protein